MNRRAGVNLLLIIWATIVAAGATCPTLAADSKDRAAGLLEIECNMAGINLRLCPKDDYVQKETKVFFGLITSMKQVCSSEEISVGKTPLRPTAVPAGTYILMIPSDYVWEKDGPIELTISPGEKTYFLLKLFSSRADRPEDDHGGGGGGGGAAAY